MGLHRIVYVSKPFGYGESMLNGILVQARHCNARDGLTGTLICRADMYMQLLEGPKDPLEAAYGRIVNDDRHLEVRSLLAEASAERVFPGWYMRDDPARSWMWTQKEVAAGAPAAASRDEILGIFTRLAAEPESLDV